ncbi:MAG TPA: TRAP transporter small permease, partial [Rubrivivax sp.]|nr:TRAP transporter small permease [Rubrivivax sp.]
VYVSKMKMIGVELEDLPVPIWVARSILPIGFALLSFRFLQVLWGLVSGKSDSLHLADEVAEALKLKAEENTK